MSDVENIQPILTKFGLPVGLASTVFEAEKGLLYEKLVNKNKGRLKRNIFAIHVSSLVDIWDVYFWLSDIFPRIEQVNKGSTKGCVHLDIKEALSLEGLHLYSDQYNKAEIPKFIFIDSFLDNYSNTKDYFNLCVLLMRYVLNSNEYSSRCLAFSTKLSKEDLLKKIEELPTNFSIVLKDLLLYIDAEGMDERI
jgi:hypothetical protein